ncbi:hypothetical protein ACWD25_35500 [Streptomyces sp. NPDC002920]
MAEAIHLAAYSGLVVQPYRDDQNRPRWAFRCWGTDTCDGWLSLDHTTEQWAARALTRHLEEAHASRVSRVAGPEIKVSLTEEQRSEVARIVEAGLRRVNNARGGTA